MHLFESKKQILCSLRPYGNFAAWTVLKITSVLHKCCDLMHDVGSAWYSEFAFAFAPQWARTRNLVGF